MTISAFSPVPSLQGFLSITILTLIAEVRIRIVVISTFVVRVESFNILTSFRDHTDLKRSRDRVIFQVTIVPVSKRHGIVETRPWREAGCVIGVKFVKCISIHINKMCRVLFKADEELLTVGDPKALHFNTAQIAYASRVIQVGFVLFVS